MAKEDYIIVTNNPMVYQKYDGQRKMIYAETSYEGLLQQVRDKVHEGHQLLSHPLSGSVKPNETPYKSVMISARPGSLSRESLRMIESAIEACKKFAFRTETYDEAVHRDFQWVDLNLIESGMESADLM